MIVFLTGCTGFIGSHIARNLLSIGHIIYASFRKSSSFQKCNDIKEQIHWVNICADNWEKVFQEVKFDVLIHTAWDGIEYDNRNDWALQINNFWFSKQFFDIALKYNFKKVISLGSQAEYGNYSYPVKETDLSNPNQAYGSIKLLTYNYLQNLFIHSQTDWYWIRVFSIFGEGENMNMLLSNVINNLSKNKPIKLTKCEQQFNYLYVNDFVNLIQLVVNSKDNKSGMYNLCNTKPVILKELLTYIATIMNVPKSLLLFGEIPYRDGQSMYISGDNSKFMNAFASNIIINLSIKNGILSTIKSINNNHENF